MNNISGYYLPNKIANTYIANRRDESGALAYEGAMQDVGIETQAAIQSLNKSYSSVINDAYTNYLNSKRNIASSNLGQGYKEAYLEQEEQTLQKNIAQADINAAETKRDILNQQLQSEANIGKAFQTEVLNMEKVGQQLSNYMNYLKNVSADITTDEGTSSQSYYDSIIKGKGLSDFAAKNTVLAEDLYDELYNAAPKGYTDEKGQAALNWEDWLSEQIKTQGDQDWYDWYVGRGGYEMFREAYKKSAGTTAADKYLAEQEAKYTLARNDVPKYAKEFDESTTIEPVEFEKTKSDLARGGQIFVQSDELRHNANNLFKYAKELGLTETEINTVLGTTIYDALRGMSNFDTSRVRELSDKLYNYARKKYILSKSDATEAAIDDVLKTYADKTIKNKNNKSISRTSSSRGAGGGGSMR